MTHGKRTAERFSLPMEGCGLALEDVPALVGHIASLPVPNGMDRTVLMVMAIDNCFDVATYPNEEPESIVDYEAGALSCAMGTVENIIQEYTEKGEN
tara:strand:+ start:192 stop:482 length:291 start_codon:yes stop_codon:yes gene_type:complete